MENLNFSSVIEMSTDNESDYSGESKNSVSDNSSYSPSEVNKTQSTINCSLEDKRGLKCLHTNADSIANTVELQWLEH